VEQRAGARMNLHGGSYRCPVYPGEIAARRMRVQPPLDFAQRYEGGLDCSFGGMAEVQEASTATSVPMDTRRRLAVRTVFRTGATCSTPLCY
jgi:hypothetical protein